MMPERKSTPSPVSRLGAFGWSALDYFDAGWFPIPVVAARQRKAPLIKGYTGYHDNWPDRSTVEQWVRDFPMASVGLRLPKNVVGIDVDSYDSKDGQSTLSSAIDIYGPLPDTWASTSRSDSANSGILLYRLPTGIEATALANKLGPDVDTIRWCHRYVTVSPSEHHTGRLYSWIKIVGGRCYAMDGEIPRPDDLGPLPTSWYKLYPILKGPMLGAVELGDPNPVITSFLGRFDPNRSSMGPILGSTLEWWTSRMDDLSLGSAHDTMIAAVYAIVSDIYRGDSGATEALKLMSDSFRTAVKGRRTERVARNEFRRATAAAILKLKGKDVSGA